MECRIGFIRCIAGFRAASTDAFEGEVALSSMTGASLSAAGASGAGSIDMDLAFDASCGLSTSSFEEIEVSGEPTAASSIAAGS